MGAAQRSIDVDVAIEDFFKVVTDYKAYADFIPEMKEVKVLSRNGPSAEVTYTIEVDAGIGSKRVSYTLRHTEDAPRSQKWTMTRGEMMKSNDGSWVLEKLSDNRTRATYTADIGFGLLVPKTVATLLTERSLPKLLEQFKARAESLYKK